MCVNKGVLFWESRKEVEQKGLKLEGGKDLAWHAKVLQNIS